MASFLNDIVDNDVKQKSEMFLKKIVSDMHSTSKSFGNSMSFEWVSEIEYACPYLDNIVRKPKVVLVNDENVVKIEKARKITVASIKDLSKHTNFIDKVDKKTQDIEPSKILDIRSEDTFNIYENRFAYTLLTDLSRYISKKEEALNNLEANNNKTLEYEATTNTLDEKISIELKINSEELPNSSKMNDFKKELELIKPRIKRINDYMTIWMRSEFYRSLQKAHAAFVKPPLTKTNIIAKNPNFQVAVKLWTYIRNTDDSDSDDDGKVVDSDGDDILKGFLDHSFLMNYFVLDSVSSSKRGEKQKLSKNVAVMLNQEIERIISLLLSSGINITDEEIMAMVAEAIKEEKYKRRVGSIDVKNKFKSAMEEYLEKARDCL